MICVSGRWGPGRMKLALAGGRLYTLGWPGVLKSSISLFSNSPV